MSYSLNRLYRAVGVSKQAVWAHFKREQAQLDLLDRILRQVDEYRSKHPGCGAEKLYRQLAPEGIGRDKFCNWLMELGYGVRGAKKSVRTTFASHKVFKNFIEGRLINGPSQIWQSDITYIKVHTVFYYLPFIMDVYTRRVVGFAASKNLRAQANLRALQQALACFPTEQLKGLVHHSDKGTQYSDSRYLKLLRSYNISISMGKIATDNAYAERINGIIKNEYLIPQQPDNFQQLKSLLKKAVNHYNNVRLHRSLNYRSPISFEKICRQLETRKQPLQIIKSERTPLFTQADSQQINKPVKQPKCVLPVN